MKEKTIDVLTEEEKHQGVSPEKEQLAFFPKEGISRFISQ